MIYFVKRATESIFIQTDRGDEKSTSYLVSVAAQASMQGIVSISDLLFYSLSVSYVSNFRRLNMTYSESLVLTR